MSATVQPVAGDPATLDLNPDVTWSARTRAAWRDVADAALLWRLCVTLSWLDIKLRYRGSLLGPFWLTLSTAVMIGSMGVIYAALFRMNLHEYLPFLALSLVLWGFVSALVGEGCTAFTTSEGMIRAVRMPFTVYAVRIVLRNLLVLAHNAVAILAVFALLRTWPDVATAAAALPALGLWLIDGLAFIMLLGPLCARFRDIPPIVGSVLQIAFFVTPVIWKPQLVGATAWVMPFNPFYSLLEIVRGPLLGEIPGWDVYVSALIYSALLLFVTSVLFARVRGRIAFWV